MYEVEVKARLKDKNAVIKKLEDLDCKFSKELHQIDRVFIPGPLSFPPPLGTSVLRVRKQDDKYFFTLKISQSGHQDSIEREMEIQDGEMMLEILKLMKYLEAPTVEKRRIKTNYKDIEIVIDVVEQLGEFIEAEKIVTSDSPEDRKNTQEELFDFLATLGVSREDRVVNGKYDIMLFEKLKNR